MLLSRRDFRQGPTSRIYVDLLRVSDLHDLGPKPICPDCKRPLTSIPSRRTTQNHILRDFVLDQGSSDLCAD